MPSMHRLGNGKCAGSFCIAAVSAFGADAAGHLADSTMASIVPCAIKCGAMVTMPSAVATIRSASLCACKCRKCLRSARVRPRQRCRSSTSCQGKSGKPSLFGVPKQPQRMSADSGDFQRLNYTAATMPSPSCFKFLVQTPGWVCWVFFVFFGCFDRMSHTPSLTYSSRDRKTEKKPNNPNLSLLLCQRPKRVPMHISLVYQLQSIDDFAFHPVQPAPQAMVAQ